MYYQRAKKAPFGVANYAVPPPRQNFLPAACFVEQIQDNFALPLQINFFDEMFSWSARRPSQLINSQLSNDQPR
jgi:hypothetical protein